MSALRHDQRNSEFNSSFRQLLHVSFKVSATMRERYLKALEEHSETISRNVTGNLFERHIKLIFLGRASLATARLHRDSEDKA